MKKCRDCYTPVGADGWRCDPCAATWQAYTDQYVESLRKAAANGYKGWEHANCDHAYDYCTTTPNNAFVPKGK